MILKYVFKRYLKKRVVALLLVGFVFLMCLFLFESVVGNDTPVKHEMKNNNIVKKKDIGLTLGVSNAGEKDSERVKTEINLRIEKPSNVYHNQTAKIPEKIIDIWSVVGLGDYTWEHILGGKRQMSSESPAELIHGNILFRYHGGDISWESLPLDSVNVLLVLNGRAAERLPFTKLWLDQLTSLPHLHSAMLMLIGSEECNNEWLVPYLNTKGGILKQVFISYDATIEDGNQIIQWPLGTATYRGFPLEDSNSLLSDDSRPYRCNFMGTVYPHSSREALMEIIDRHNLRDYCYIKARQKWDAEETKESMGEYIKVLQQSDLTLSPVGKNIECYRIYEAAALGSVPVIEDMRTSQQCSERTLRLLKQMKAPFIYIKDWSELVGIIRAEMKKTPEMIIERRKNLVEWYQEFKTEMRKILINQIEIHL